MFPQARKAIVEALGIMNELGLQEDAQYGSMLSELGSLDMDLGQHKKALEIFNKAKAVLVHCKERRDYGVLLSNMAGCHVRLNQWNGAVACLNEAVEHSRTMYGTDHPDYAAVLSELAGLFCMVKQYEEAILRFEEVLAVRQRVLQHQCTVITTTCLALARQDAKKSHRDEIDVGHEFRVQPVRQHRELECVCMLPRMVLWCWLPAATLGHAQAALRCVPALQHTSDQDQALLALQQGQVMQPSVPKRPLGPAQDGSALQDGVRRRLASKRCAFQRVSSMDVRGSVDETIGQVVQEFNVGNYRGAVSLLEPLLRPRAKEKLSPQQECDVVACLSSSYGFLSDEKSALPHTQRWVALEKQLHGPRSQHRAVALKVLCMVHRGLQAFPQARKAITEALGIMDELGLQQDEEYGLMLLVLGSLDNVQGQYKEALEIYDKAKAVLGHYKEGRDYGALLHSMAGCHVALSQLNEAVACYKEAVEHRRTLNGPDHPNYAAVLADLAALFCMVKQYEEAIPRYEEVLVIQQRVFGDQHQRTLSTAEHLAWARQQAKKSHRDKIDVGHEFRMCSQCGYIQENMNVCPCFRAWYCGADCQLQHWEMHKPHCNVCLHCNTLLTKSMRCSRCNKAKYCNAACQKAHWSQHKTECVAPTGK
jgi:tetratricopeptide (TPR) repeat protein